MRRPRIAFAFLVLAFGALFSFSLDNGHTSDGPPAANYSALEPARFEISFYRGEFRIDGHTVSSGHELQLLNAAARSDSGHAAETTFMPVIVAPDRWASTTVSLLESLATTQSSSAVLTHDTLRIRGVATGNWEEQLRKISAALPEATHVDADIVIPDVHFSTADLCARAFAAHAPGPVNFDESGTKLRTSAYLSLDRTIALADACRAATVSITGHTDSSGNETSNRQLSLARAQVVADYVVERGIARDRLIVAGAGSSFPVADNRNRYGRSLNRRIAIDLTIGKPEKGNRARVNPSPNHQDPSI